MGWSWNSETKADEYDIDESERGIPIGITKVGSWLLSEENRPRLHEHLSRYFSVGYSGKHFEQFVSRSSTECFTPWDVLAVKALSVDVPSDQVIPLVEGGSSIVDLIRDANQGLREDDTLWTCDRHLLQGEGALSRLYCHLREVLKLGPVTTSKLLAAKFPNVVPIRDSRVELLLDMSRSIDWWLPIRGVFELHPQLAQHIDSVPLPPNMPDVTTLRRLDVILWMEAKARGIRRGAGN